MKKITSLLLLCIFLISCATVPTPQKRFPEFAEQVKNISDVDVIFDVVIASDIAGPDPGIDVQQHTEAIAAVEGKIVNHLVKKGYNVNILHANGGLFIEHEDINIPSSTLTSTSNSVAPGVPVTSSSTTHSAIPESATDTEIAQGHAKDKSAAEKTSKTDEDSPKLKYVFIKDKKSTGEAVTGPFITAAATPWTDYETREFLKTLFARGTKYFHYSSSSKSRKKKKTEPEPSTILENVPPSITELSSDALLVIKIRVGEVATSKSIGTSILTGLITAALSGGTYIAVSTPVSGSIIDATVFDPKTSAILWFNTVRGGGPGNFQNSVDLALKPLNEAAKNIIIAENASQDDPGTNSSDQKTVITSEQSEEGGNL